MTNSSRLSSRGEVIGSGLCSPSKRGTDLGDAVDLDALGLDTLGLALGLDTLGLALGLDALGLVGR